MSELEDTWPMPRYRTAHDKQMHAIGVITQNFHQFEYGFFRLFGHHFEKLGTPANMVWTIYNRLQDNQRSQAIIDVFDACETNPQVIEHIRHVIKFFNKCSDNRNWIFHSRIDLNHTLPKLRLKKGLKEDWERENRIDLSLPQLRKIADDMFTGWEYLWHLFAYLQGRDFSQTIHPAFLLTFPATLPEKPTLPDSIKPIQSPKAH
jgi:hypothetical protein